MSSLVHLAKKRVVDPDLLWIGLLVLAGFLLRFWKIDFGLPEVPFSNEELPCYIAFNMSGGDLNPHNFYHPNLYYYAYFFFDILYVLGGIITGMFKVSHEAWQLFKTNPTAFYVIGRSISATTGVLTIPLIYLVGKKTLGREVGILGSFFLTFSFLHVQWSPMAYTDVPLTLLILLSFLFGFSALETGKLRDFVLCGFFGGLSASTKYQGLETLFWGPLASYLFNYANNKNPLKGLFTARSLSSLVFFASGFTLGTPFWILDFPTFWAHFTASWHWFRPYGLGHIGIEGDWNWLYYLKETLATSIGVPLLIAGGAGMLVLARRRDRKALFFLSFPVVYFLIAGISKIRQAKYMMPLLPFLLLSAAYLLVFLVERWSGRDRRRFSIVLSLAAFLVALPTTITALRFSYLKTVPETRKLANAWVDTHVPGESKVLVTSMTRWGASPQGSQFVDLDAGLFNQRVYNQSSLRSLSDYRREGFDYVVLDEWHLGSLLVEEANNPKYQETIRRYEKFLAELKSSGERVAEFSPYKEGVAASFDRENLNFATRRLWKLKSLGPLIQIYKLSG